MNIANKQFVRDLPLYILVMSVLFLINYIVNSWIVIYAPVVDDPHLLNMMNTMPAYDFIFNTYAYKFRPVFNASILFFYNIFGDNLNLFAKLNFVIHFIIAIVVFGISKNISKHILLSLCLPILYIVSRFSYYSLGQILGFMESSATLFAILSLFLLYKYLNESLQNIMYYNFSLVLLVLLIYTHERYIALFPLYIIVYVFKTSFKNITFKNIFLALIPFFIFILFALQRVVLFKGRIMDGPGGTDIKATFQLEQFFLFVYQEMCHILGINLGDNYLIGIRFVHASLDIKIVSWVTLFLLLTITVSTIIAIVKDSSYYRAIYIKNILLFIFFIAALIVSSSTTFRLELRWVYTQYVVFLFLLAYLYSILVKSFIFKHYKFVILIVFLLYSTLSIYTGLYYKGYMRYVYFWGAQECANSFYVKTLAKDKLSFWDGNYVIVNEGHLTFGTNQQFLDFFNLSFNALKPNDVVSSPNIIFVDSIDNITKDMAKSARRILYFDPYDEVGTKWFLAKNFFYDITSPIVNQKK